jgi:hypothetical protein
MIAEVRMRDVRQAGGGSQESAGRESGGSPGKRTLVEQVYRKRSSEAAPGANASDALAQAGSEGGQAPDAGVRGKVEQATGADLSGVRVHTGASSNAAAEAVSARAYTVGQDVHFAAGEYNPGSQEGNRLIAHELAHAAQQGPASAGPQFKLEVSQPGDSSEVEADRIADQVVGGDTGAAQGVSSTGPMVSREVAEGGEGGKKKAPTETESIAGASLWAKDDKGNDLPPSIEDVRQGGVNDCFVFAAMAAIVHSDPDKIKKMIKDNGDGSYTVTFEGTGIVFSDSQTVTADFEKGRHGNVHSTRKALWPLIIEKAYAKQKGGLDVLDKGGNAGTAADDMVNMSASRFNPKDKDADAILALLAKAQTDKKPTTFLAPAEKVANVEQKKIAKDIPGMHLWHFYAVTAVDDKGRKIKLYNPWGYDHPNGDGWLSVDDAKKFFIECDING